MSFDFQVVLPQESIHLNSVKVLKGPPASLDIIGTDFTAVDEVLINNTPSDSFVILNSNRLLAEIPSSIGASSNITVAVLSKQLTVTPRSLIRFRIGRTPGRTTGILRLIQLFLKILFTTPGTDIFSPKVGGGGLKNIGQTFGISEGSNIVNDFVISVNNTARQIIAFQSKDAKLPRDERLMSARITKSAFDKVEGALLVTVEITSQAGKAALANLEL